MSEITLNEAKDNAYYAGGFAVLQSNLTSLGSNINTNTKDPGGDESGANSALSFPDINLQMFIPPGGWVQV